MADEFTFNFLFIGCLKLMSEPSADEKSSAINPNWFILFIVVVGLGYGYWVFSNQTASTNPHWQQYVNTETLPSHRVNLWTEPYPVRSGQVRFTVQFDFVDFMDSEVGSAQLILSSPEGDRFEFRLEAVEDTDRGLVYETTATMQRTGRWMARIKMSYQGQSNVTQFTIPIEGAQSYE